MSDRIAQMSLRQRLRLSNILMILVPLALCAAVAAVCLGVVWNTMQHGAGVRLDDEGSFYWAAKASEELVESTLGQSGDTKGLAEVARGIEGSSLSLLVTDGRGATVFSSADVREKDQALVDAARLAGSGTVISTGDRSLYWGRVRTDAGDFDVAVLGSRQVVGTGALKRAAVLSVIAILTTAAVAVVLMNRVCRRLVYDRVTEGLGLLDTAADHVSQGDLEHRIGYTGTDEFRPICDSFDGMVASLEAAAERDERERHNRRELIAGISHDLRSPLTSIQGYVEGLLDGVATTPEMRERYLRTVRRKAHDMEQLVSQLFLFSKLDLQEYPCEPRLLDLAGWVRGLVDAEGADSAWAERGIRLAAGPLEPAMAVADGALLERCVTNALDNACKYAPGAQVALATRTNADGTVTLSVSDDGPGVPDDQVGRLFDVFYRTDKSRTAGEGSGLGLAIVRRALEQMGGHVSARRADEGGLCIEMTLPGAMGPADTAGRDESDTEGTD